MALRYWIEASLYLAFSKYLFPLSRYRFLATFGSRLQDTKASSAMSASATERIERICTSPVDSLTLYDSRTLFAIGTTAEGAHSHTLCVLVTPGGRGAQLL